jgi:ubiquinone/menaquinone biosynthesis C-methylase UbiE
LGIPVLLIFLHTLIRIVRHFHKFPMPEFAANIIDNPIRRKIQPPDQTAVRHGIQPGMTVLDVGPGNGTYTLAAARRVGPQGKVVAIDIETRMIARVECKIQAEGITNIEARAADVFDLPFDDHTFDLIYMITVSGEIPDFPKALQEFHRILTPSGTLAFSEFFSDPDYPLASTLIRKVSTTGFRLQEKIGNFFNYTLIFEKEQAHIP